MRKQLHPLFLLFLAMATFGFVHQLITNPMGILYDFLFFAAVILIFFGIYHFFFKQNQTKYYRQRQSPSTSGPFSLQKLKKSFPKVNPNKNVTTMKDKEKSKAKKKKIKDHPFKVIEGNKGKKKKPYSS
jgi:glucan phosphoethanolaminetransferase (alkaline phosphatase superfamily)